MIEVLLIREAEEGGIKAQEVLFYNETAMVGVVLASSELSASNYLGRTSRNEACLLQP